MKRNLRPIILGLVLSVTTIFLLNMYIKDINKVDETPSAHSQIVVAKETIPDHTVITSEMVGIVEIHDDAVHPSAIKSTDEVVGGISRGEIISGEQILSKKIVTDDIKASLSYRVPANMRAITIPLDEVSGVANHIVKGDKVDVIATYSGLKDTEGARTYTQLQNIEVLELGVLVGRKETEEGETQTVERSGSMTLLVNPEQAEVIAFATLNGKFHLTLRNPADDSDLKLDYYGHDNFKKYKGR